MKTGFIGLGAMGRHMARHLLGAGHLIGVWNRTRETTQAWWVDVGSPAGVILADTPATLAARCELVVSCVSDDAALREVVSAMAPALAPGTVWVDTSTVGRETICALARHLARCGVHSLDAPVTGGVEGARDARLVMLVGGERDTLARVRPTLASFTRRIEHMGILGTGQAAKAVNQLMVAGINQAVTEALAFGEALARESGLDTARLAEVLGGGAAGSWFLDHRGASMLAGDYTPGFKLALHHKDLGLCQELARGMGARLPLVDMTLAHYGQLMDAGRGGEDISVLIEQKRTLFKQKS